MINISYHSWKDFRDCPKKYFLKNRLRKPSSVPRNDYYMLYGKLVEKFFEIFCNTWRYKMAYMPPEEIRLKLKTIYDGVLSSSVVNWDAPFVTSTQEDIFNQAYADVCSIMESQTQNYFLNTRSEVSIEIKINVKMDSASAPNVPHIRGDVPGGACLKGRLDFVHADALNPKSITIFDGKGTNNIGKNIEDYQVLFYALLYFLHFKVLPDQLGFFYYRFNTFKPVAISLDVLNEFRAKLSLDIKKILASNDFIAMPSPKSCKYCDYRTACKECMEDQAKRSKGSKLDIPDQEGIVDLGF
jgi:CRISPR/Cas system-associated exonuclease Cas4 (RecB family)